MFDAENLALQNRILSEEVKRRVEQLAAINTVAASVGQSLDLDITLETALSAVLSIVGAEAGGISLIEEQTGDVVLRAQRGWVHDFVSNPMRIPAGKGMSGQVINEDRLMLDNDLDGTEELYVPSFRDEKFRSIAMAPMHARGKIIGILSLMSYKPDRFDEDVMTVLRSIADTVGVALGNARLYETTLENEKRLDAIVQSTADGMIATDRNGRVVMINHAAETIFDTDTRKLIGKPLREAPIHPRIRESLLFALSSREGEATKAFKVTIESGRMFSIVVSPVYVESQIDQKKETDGWVIVLQDVTHLRESEVTRAQFIQAAAHDMRNPLGVALSSLNMLETAFGIEDPAVLEILGISISGIRRMQDMIEDLLNLEHIESGFGSNMGEVDLVDMIRELSQEMKPVFASKNQTYTTDIPFPTLSIQLDRKWVSRAILNYLNNASKYTDEGGKISLKMYTNERLVHIEVTDNGPGIAADSQARLFERFYRVPDIIGTRGTGLGLAITKSVAEAHGGRVYVRSQQGQGSTFAMALPLVN